MAEAATLEEPVDAVVVDEEEETGPVSAGAELVHVPGAHDVSLWRSQDPTDQIAEASKLAAAFKDVVKQQGLIATIREREHPQVEAWQLLGSMLGVHPVPVGDPQPLPWPDPVPEGLKDQHKRGLTFGFTASYIAVKNGETVGGGQSRCTRSESTWKPRDDFALASMAQTRAISKALSGPLRFVMVLAGYQATPAEEMPDETPKQAQADPHGEAIKRGMVKHMQAAILKIVAGDAAEAHKLHDEIVAKTGGTFRQASATALVLAAKALDGPTGPVFSDPTGDIPTDQQAQRERARAQRAQVTPEAIQAKEAEVRSAWVATGLSTKDADKLVSGCGGNWERLLKSEEKARETFARKAAMA